MGTMVGIVGLLAIIFGWHSFRRWQEIGKVKRRGPVLIEQDGNRYRVAFDVRPVPGLPGGPFGILPPDYLRASVSAEQGAGWQELRAELVPFTFGYYGRWETQDRSYDGDRLDGLAAQLVADTINPPRWPRNYQ